MLQTYCGTRLCMLAFFLLPSRSFPPPVFDHLQYAKTYTKAKLAVCKNIHKSKARSVQKHTQKQSSQCAKTYTKTRLAVCKNLKQKQRACLIPMIPCMSLRMRLYEKLQSSA